MEVSQGNRLLVPLVITSAHRLNGSWLGPGLTTASPLLYTVALGNWNALGSNN